MKVQLNKPSKLTKYYYFAVGLDKVQYEEFVSYLKTNGLNRDKIKFICELNNINIDDLHILTENPDEFTENSASEVVGLSDIEKAAGEWYKVGYRVKMGNEADLDYKTLEQVPREYLNKVTYTISQRWINNLILFKRNIEKLNTNYILITKEKQW